MPNAKFLYDYALCDGVATLQAVIQCINVSGYSLVCVSQYEHTYTVFFRRPVNG